MGGSSNAPLDHTPNKKSTTLLYNNPSNPGGGGGGPYDSIYHELSLCLFNRIMNISYHRVSIARTHGDPSKVLVKSISLGDLGITRFSFEGQLILNFAQNYNGNVRQVRDFCAKLANNSNTHVSLDKRFEQAVIYSMLFPNEPIPNNAKGSLIIDAIRAHR